MTYYCIAYNTVDSDEWKKFLTKLSARKRSFECLLPLDFANIDFFQKEDSFIGRES